MDWGLLGAIGSGLQSGTDAYRSERSYEQKKQQDSDELAIKKRLARVQEMEAAARISDSTGYMPSDLYSPSDSSGLMNQSPGLVKPQTQGNDQIQSGSSNPNSAPNSEFLTQPVNTPLMPKHVRDGVKEAAQLSASAYGKGVTYKYDPQTRSIRSFEAPRNEEHDLDLASKREAFRKAQEDSQNVKPEQGQAALFGKRMQDAEQVFSDLERSGYSRGTATEGIKSSLLPGALQGPQLKRQDQAERNFVNAVLRRESGAAIAQSEFDNAEKQYFPRAGDTSEVLAQKQQNRQLAINAMQQQAGKKAWSGLVSPSLQSSRPSGLMGNKITVSNGKETLSIDASDLQSAQQDGYQVVK